MTLLKLCMVAVPVLALLNVIKSWRSDFLPLVRLSAVVLFGAVLLSAGAPLFDYIKSLGSVPPLSEHMASIFSGLGIAILSQICSDICRESGEASLATQVELAGKLELLLLCIPLMEKILATARSLLEMGGQG